MIRFTNSIVVRGNEGIHVNGKLFTNQLVALRRWLGLDHNPIRRRTDRLESVAMLTALALVVLSLPLALAVGFMAQHQSMTLSQAQYATRHETGALVTGAPVAVTADGGATVFLADAQWSSSDGMLRSGTVEVPANAEPMSTVQIWTDAAGTPVQAPLSSTSALGRGVLATVGTVAGLAVLFWGGVLVARRVLNRRRLVDWDVEWRRVSPQWT